MSDPTPAEALRAFRRATEMDVIHKAVEGFNAMPMEDRLELMFYMVQNTNNAMYQLSLAFGVEGEVNEFPGGRDQ